MLLNLFANILFPPVCVACRRRVRRGVICRRCFKSIGIRDALSCGQCLVRLPGARNGTSARGASGSAKKICHPDFPFLLGAAGRYENRAMKALIHHLKFRSIRDAAKPLATLMLRHVSRAKIDLRGFIVMPIPLSNRRLRVRGYNQAELIARHFVEMLGKTTSSGMGSGCNPVNLSVAANTLVRAKHTQPQSATESIAERKENIRGAFAVQNPDAICGKNILLIDDVTTSGATFLEAALALKAAGANKIICLAAAKA